MAATVIFSMESRCKTVCCTAKNAAGGFSARQRTMKSGISRNRRRNRNWSVSAQSACRTGNAGDAAKSGDASGGAICAVDGAVDDPVDDAGDDAVDNTGDDPVDDAGDDAIEGAVGTVVGAVVCTVVDAENNGAADAMACGGTIVQS